MNSCSFWPGAQIRSDDVMLRGAVGQHHQHLDRVAEIIMIELVVADAVQLHRLLRRQHEIERRSHRPPVRERRRQSARRDPLRAHEGDAHIAAGRVRLEIEQPLDILVASCPDASLPLARSLALCWRGESGARRPAPRLLGTRAGPAWRRLPRTSRRRIVPFSCPGRDASTKCRVRRTGTHGYADVDPSLQWLALFTFSQAVATARCMSA